MTRSWWPVVVVALVGAVATDAAAQVILRPSPGVTIIQPTFEPPYRLTIRVYVETHDGRPLPPALGASVLVTDPQGRRVGADTSGAFLSDPGSSRPRCPESHGVLARLHPLATGRGHIVRPGRSL